MGTVRFPDGARFSLERSDIIIMILANVVVGTSFLWLLTRKSWVMRIGALGFLMAIRLATGAGGEGAANWVATVWRWQPPYFEWLWVTGYWGYLFITVPGTIAGDLMLRWMRPAEPGEEPAPAWEPSRMAAVGILAFAATPLALWGLFTRNVAATVVASAVLGIVLLLMTRDARTPTERLLGDFMRWGFACLMLGLVFEPYEGGIKKDPATMSYYFVTAGLALWMLAALTVAIDAFRGRKAFALLIGNGQNPMIAYIGMSTLVQPLLFLTGINPFINRFTEGRPMAQFAHGAAATLLLAVIVYGFSRARLYWRT